MAGAWSLAPLQWRCVAVRSRGCARKSDGLVEMIVLTRSPSLPQVRNVSYKADIDAKPQRNIFVH